MPRIARVFVPGVPHRVTQRFDGLTALKAWRAMLAEGAPAEEGDALRRRVQTGRALGSPGFVERIEDALGRALRRRKPGPKPKAEPPHRPGAWKRQR